MARPASDIDSPLVARVLLSGMSDTDLLGIVLAGVALLMFATGIILVL